MRIHGFLKLTLLDYPGLTACTIFSGGCNFRCPFCHNASLVLDPDSATLCDENEILSYLKKRVGIIDGVCFTGGEPLLEKDLIDFMRKVKDIGMKVKLDTNGFLFEKMKEVIETGLVDYVAMDIKNSLTKYGRTVGVNNLDTTNIQKSIQYLMNCGINYEFRTTIVDELHEPEDFNEISPLIKGCKHYYLQCFEDSGDLIGADLHAPSGQKVKQIQEALIQNGINPILRNFDL